MMPSILIRIGLNEEEKQSGGELYLVSYKQSIESSCLVSDILRGKQIIYYQKLTKNKLWFYTGMISMKMFLVLYKKELYCYSSK